MYATGIAHGFSVPRLSAWSLPALLAVLALHALAFAALLALQSRPNISPPVVLSVSLITPQPPRVIKPDAPKPKPVANTRVAVEPRPAPAPASLPASLPTPLATASPSAAPTEAIRPAVAAPPPAAVVATPAAVAPAPAAAHAPAVTAPRFDAAYLDNPKPAYPAISRRLMEQGRVVLRVHVDVEGRAGEVELHTTSGSPRLDQSALETVRRWRFLAARRGAEPMAAWVLVPIAFTLKD